MKTFLIKSTVAAAMLASAALAQQPAAAIPAPAPVSQIFYRHWPEHFMQWTGAEVPYSMFEVYVDAAAAGEPVYDIVMTERATWKRVHYSNSQPLVDFTKRTGGDAYFTKIQFDRPAKAGAGATFVLRFADQNGLPVLWQFVQGSEVAERGGGLSPAGMQPPVLMYRERAAVAGEGTALKIGNVVSAADVWKEIAQPPYFVPYRGAYTENVEIATFVDGAPAWTVEQGPATLAAGAEWKVKSADGRAYTLTASAVQGDSATFVQADPRQQTKITLEAKLVNGAWQTRKIRFEPTGPGNSKGLTIQFNHDGQQQTAKFEVQNGKTRIAQGALVQSSWQFRDPEWLRGKAKAASNKDAAPASGSGGGK